VINIVASSNNTPYPVLSAKALKGLGFGKNWFFKNLLPPSMD
jgi:hypothetical protein